MAAQLLTEQGCAVWGMDGRYRRLRFSGEGGSRRSMGESGIRASAYIMGSMDVEGGAGLTLTVWFR